MKTSFWSLLLVGGVALSFVSGCEEAGVQQDAQYLEVSSGPVPVVAPESDPGVDPFTARVVELTNNYRKANGVESLELNPELRAAAQTYAEKMSSLNFFSHTSPDGTNPADRITAAGYEWSTWGENIAMGYVSPDSVVNGWIASPGHRANLLNSNFKEIGVGHSASGNYWVQSFGARL